MKTKILLLTIALLSTLWSFGQTNSFVTEYYLSQNFTPKSGVTPGTNNTLWMDCDQIKARYNVNVAGVTTTGNRLPSQNQLTASFVITIASISNLTPTGFTANITISNPGNLNVTSRGIVYSTTTNPSFPTNAHASGSGSTAFSVNSGTLIASTTYHIKAYALADGTFYYSTEVDVTTPAPCLAIGDSYLGGKVAYIFAPGDHGFVSGECHGIVVYGSDLADKAWGCAGTYTSTTEDVGYAYENTAYIATASCGANSAAKACYDFFIVGELENHQWALPTLGDLRKIYDNRSALGSFVSDYYWSSSSNDSDVAKSISFTSGANGYINKTTVDKVRPIRYF